jgi:hypothetical protein
MEPKQIFPPNMAGKVDEVFKLQRQGGRGGRFFIELT